MGLFRLLFWVAMVFAAIWLWRRLSQKGRRAPEQAVVAPMVRCSQCGIHVPREHALPHNESWYCSQAHLEQDSHSSER
ncbi:MAG: PP0621 family protein [Pseudomonadota bacterium]